MLDFSTPRPLAVIGAPSSAGAYGPGQEHTPAAFRRHGLLDALRSRGRRVVDVGDGPLTGWEADPGSAAANAETVTAVARGLADSVADALAGGHDVLVLGGDCTVELGTVAGALSDPGSPMTVALAYVDLHTCRTGDGILDWMGVAHLLNLPGTHGGVAGEGPKRPMLPPRAVRLLATDNITSAERTVIDTLGIRVEPLRTVTEQTADVVRRTLTWALAYDSLLVHVDVDVLDWEKFPIAENTGRRGGLGLDTLTGLLTGLCTAPNFRGLTIDEINPSHAPDETASFAALIHTLTAALGSPTRARA